MWALLAGVGIIVAVVVVIGLLNRGGGTPSVQQMETRVEYAMDVGLGGVREASSSVLCDPPGGERFRCHVKVYALDGNELKCEGNVVARKGAGKGAIFDESDESLNCF